MAELSSGPVKTFSIGFAEKEYDELPYARAVAERYGTDHHEFIVRPNATAIFDKLVWHYNEPYADESAIPTYYLSEVTRRHVTVALNGDGGDENFGGYRRYQERGRVPWLAAGIRPFHAQIAALERLTPATATSAGVLWRGKRWVQRACAAPGERYAWRMMHFDPFLKSTLCTPAFLEGAGGDVSTALLLSVTTTRAPRPRLTGCSTPMWRTIFPIACSRRSISRRWRTGSKGDRRCLITNSWSLLHACRPTSRCAAAWEIHLQEGDQSLVAARDPGTTQDGVRLPLDHWFRADLRELAYDTLLGRPMAERGYFDMRMVKRLLDEHVSGVADWSDQLWNLLMLERWHQMFIDERPPIQRRDIGLALSTA